MQHKREEAIVTWHRDEAREHLTLSSRPMQSPEFPGDHVTAEQVKTVLSTMSDPLSGTGSFILGDIKFMVVGNPEENEVRGKCAGGGCCVVKTVQTLVVGVWAEPLSHGVCNKVVEALAEYLVGVSY
jgi:hypothetical protein